MTLSVSNKNMLSFYKGKEGTWKFMAAQHFKWNPFKSLLSCDKCIWMVFILFAAYAQHNATMATYKDNFEIKKNKINKQTTPQKMRFDIIYDRSNLILHSFHYIWCGCYFLNFIRILYQSIRLNVDKTSATKYFLKKIGVLPVRKNDIC